MHHRKVKYLNNCIEADHGKVKRLIKPALGFKSLNTAYATIKEFEIMKMFKKGEINMWNCTPGLIVEVRLVGRQFGIYEPVDLLSFRPISSLC